MDFDFAFTVTLTLGQSHDAPMGHEQRLLEIISSIIPFKDTKEKLWLGDKFLLDVLCNADLGLYL